MVTLFLLATLVCCTLAHPFLQSKSTCTPPDGVQSHLVFESCSSTDVIQPNAVSVLGSNGQVVYPVDLTKPLTLSAHTTNTGTTTYNSLLIDVTLSYWGKLFSFGACSWHNVPTFGFLNNINQCANCPLKPGPLVINVDIDLSNYGPIVNFITGNTPYKLIVRARNGDTSDHEEIACVKAEMIVQKGSS